MPRYFAHDLPVLTAAKLCGLNYRTAHRLCELLRQRVLALAVRESPPLVGEAEVDESYFGPRRVRGKRGRGAGGKIPVIGLHKRGQNVCLSVVKNCSRQERMPIITGLVILHRQMESLRKPGAQRLRTSPHSSSPKPVRPRQKPRQQHRKLLELRQVSLPQTARCSQGSLPPPTQRMRMAFQPSPR